MSLLSEWSLRRVLLAGLPGDMLRAMESQLCAVGARPFHASVPFGEESLSRALQQHRCACVIVPDLLALHPCDPQARLAALDMLLFEAREAGVPLALLLGRAAAAHRDETAQLFSLGQGWARGAFGDPVSVLCIRHEDADVHRVCHEALIQGAQFLADASKQKSE